MRRHPMIAEKLNSVRTSRTLAISPSTLWRLINRRDLQGGRQLGRRVRDQRARILHVIRNGTRRKSQ